MNTKLNTQTTSKLEVPIQNQLALHCAVIYFQKPELRYPKTTRIVVTDQYYWLKFDLPRFTTVLVSDISCKRGSDFHYYYSKLNLTKTHHDSG